MREASARKVSGGRWSRASVRLGLLFVKRIKDAGGDRSGGAESWQARGCLFLEGALEAWSQEHGDGVVGFCAWACDLRRLREWEASRLREGRGVPEAFGRYLAWVMGGESGPEPAERALERHGYLSVMTLGWSEERRFAELASEADKELEQAALRSGLSLREWPESEEAAVAGVAALMALREASELWAVSREPAAGGSSSGPGSRRI